MTATAPHTRFRAIAVGLALYVGAILVMTLSDHSPAGLIWRAARAATSLGIPMSFDAAEQLGNIGIFIPLGIFAQAFVQERFPGLSPAERWLRAAAITLAGCALSSCVEALQGILLPARVPSLHDVALNTLGTALGAAGACAWSIVRAPRRGR
ncbi:VanZ family protein [Rarobacter incanus]|uniref:VanZ like protein n=1 Tax=Rarobacter incanus TaxID=153494 RepID=A0A542SM89_9MICO|nr:VanZ family protein [Rarobacter incanus]TQK75733.1 VanZ like protein [Rarobacter incanus]